MKREDLKELHYITRIENVPSICKLGILSLKRASKIKHESVAMPEIQERRAKKRIPLKGRWLHEYANIYFTARNPMLYKLKSNHDKICILKIDIKVLDIVGVIISNGNAASTDTRFDPVSEGLNILDYNLVFSKYWADHEDPIENLKHKSIKCAEVLIPDRVDPKYLLGAYVSCPESLNIFNSLGTNLLASIEPDYFFQ